ncbi:MAG TPA: hypothetical protein PL110_01005 [Candidatus Eremiobacteraeota bacterium]|nr:MAG: hypothetical protein BWY64_02675 [bacterium ADurb.Bin363]HPZ06664.1 hypothetical protein [Candidatus Eremiobacteraeota bacterium]
MPVVRYLLPGKTMKRFVKNGFLFLLLVSFFLSFLSCSYANIKIDQTEFRNRKVTFKNFKIPLFSNKGDMIVGLEQVSELSLRKEGKTYALHILKFDLEKNAVTSWEKAYLDASKVDQLVLSEEEDKVLVIINGGTRLVLLDIKTMKIKTIFKHEKGKEGFRAERIGMFYEGNFYIKGYFYDKEQFSQGNCIAKVDLTKTGVEALEKTLDFKELSSKFDGIISSMYIVSPEVAYFSILRTRGTNPTMHLLAYKDKKLTEIDKGFDIPDIAGCPTRVLYDRTKSEKGNDEVKIYDLTTGKKWDIGSYIPYSFISRNGKVIVVSQFNYSQSKMNFFVGREEDNFKVKPFMENVSAGSFKLSGDGRAYAFLSTNLIIRKF